MKREKTMTGKKSGAAKNPHPIQTSRSHIKQEYQSILWKCGEGEHLIDIIPYRAGKNHPILNEGDFGFDLDFFLHLGTGTKGQSFICRSRISKKPCPICEELQKRRNSIQFDPEELRRFSPVRRVLYNIIVHDNIGEEKKGVQLWETSHYLMAMPLLSMSWSQTTGELVLFAHPSKKGGKSISFVRKGTNPLDIKYFSHKFVDRRRGILNKHLEAALPLDQVIHIPSYEEVFESNRSKGPAT